MPTCNGCLRSSFAAIVTAHTGSLTGNTQRPQDLIGRAFREWEMHGVTRLMRDRYQEGVIPQFSGQSGQGDTPRLLWTKPTEELKWNTPGNKGDRLVGSGRPASESSPSGNADRSTTASEAFPGVYIEEIPSRVSTIPGVSPATASDTFPGVNLQEIPGGVHTIAGATTNRSRVAWWNFGFRM